jgi:hypothetical protein
VTKAIASATDQKPARQIRGSCTATTAAHQHTFIAQTDKKPRGKIAAIS